MAYIFVHLILDRIGRKLPYCLFATLFGIVAILILPVQKFMTKDSRSKFDWLIGEIDRTFFVICRSNNSDEFNQWFIEILRIGILCDYLHLRK